MQKIIDEEKPKYIMVAFDIGKNFRKEKYETYKAGRSETPEELKLQMPVARKILEAMGIKYYELEPFEADDIIGTFAEACNNNKEFPFCIVPVFSFCNSRFRDIYTELSTVCSFQKLGEASTFVAIHFKRK
mgnify:CR=1 FL=1